jgi:hypothetical protein
MVGFKFELNARHIEKNLNKSTAIGKIPSGNRWEWRTSAKCPSRQKEERGIGIMWAYHGHGH